MLAPLSLSHTLSNLKPQVIHLHSGVWFKAAYASRLAGVAPAIFTDHGRPYPDTLAHRCLDGLAALMTAHVVAVSAPLKEYLATRLWVPRAKLSVIPNGIHLPTPADPREMQSLRRGLAIESSSLVLGSVGRLDPVKAYDRLIRAFAELRGRDGHRLVLLLVGEGPERSRLEQLADALNLGDSVRFLGWRKDIPQLLSLMDVFVLPSDSEGTSLSLLEALASETAVVATAVGGTPDVLGSPPAGLLVPPGDLDALVAAIGGLLRNPDHRRVLGASGRSRVSERYSFEAMADAYHSLYEQIVSAA